MPSNKHLVCQGALCQCTFGAVPDGLKVHTHSKEYINDPDGQQKLTASTKDVSATFEKNTFGPCQKQPLPGGGFKPCQAVVSEWKGFYEKLTLSNGGKVLLEESVGTCPIGGPGCIKILFHGQVAEVAPANMERADEAVLAHLFPFANLKEPRAGQGIPKNG